MLRFTVCGLVAGLLAVSALPLDETTTELPVLTTTAKPISFDDVMHNSDIKIMIDVLTDCDYQDPKNKSYRKAIEDGLRDLMNRKNFSQHIDGVLLVIWMSRNLMCPSPYAYLRESTATSSDNEVPVTQQSKGPNAQEPSENLPNHSADLADQPSNSRLDQPNESSSNNNGVSASQQSNGPNAQESSENLPKPIAEHKDQQ